MCNIGFSWVILRIGWLLRLLIPSYIISSYVFAFVNSSLHRHSPLYSNNNIPCAIVVSATTRWFRGQSKHFKRRRKGSWFCNRTLLLNFIFGSDMKYMWDLLWDSCCFRCELALNWMLFIESSYLFCKLVIAYQLTDLVYIGFLRDAWEKFSNVAWLFYCYFFSIYK